MKLVELNVDDDVLKLFAHSQQSTSFNIVQQNRTDVEANVESVCPVLKDLTTTSSYISELSRILFRYCKR